MRSSVPTHVAPRPTRRGSYLSASYLLGEVTHILWDDGADVVEAFHTNRKRAGGVMSLRRCSFVKRKGVRTCDLLNGSQSR